MSDRWTDRLSEYLDGELSGAERVELEAHLAGCPECVAALDELRRVMARAGSLEDRPPAADLWPDIAARIGAGAPATAAPVDLAARRAAKRGGLRERRLSFSLPQLAAASIALMVLSAGAAWLVSTPGGRIESPAARSAAGGATTVSAVPAVAPGVANYDAAVAELERVIEERRDELDPATVRAIEENLLIIDRAIAQAQRALSADPVSIYLNEHLTATMRQKLEFLQRAAQMAGAVS